MRILHIRAFKKLNKFIIMFKSTQCSLASVLSTLLYTIITGDVLFERMKILCKNLLDVKDTKDFNDILFIVEIIGKREMVERIKLPKNYIKRFYIDCKLRVNLNEDSLEVVKTKFMSSLLFLILIIYFIHINYLKG